MSTHTTKSDGVGLSNSDGIVNYKPAGLLKEKHQPSSKLVVPDDPEKMKSHTSSPSHLTSILADKLWTLPVVDDLEGPERSLHQHRQSTDKHGRRLRLRPDTAFQDSPSYDAPQLRQETSCLSRSLPRHNASLPRRASQDEEVPPQIPRETPPIVPGGWKSNDLKPLDNAPYATGSSPHQIPPRVYYAGSTVLSDGRPKTLRV